MRLIDADPLLKGRQDHTYISTHEIWNAPTVDAEPVRHGHWKPFDLSWGRSIYSCTNCGTAMEVPREMGEPIYNYCPYCGAKMNESEVAE